MSRMSIHSKSLRSTVNPSPSWPIAIRDRCLCFSSVAMNPYHRRLYAL
jgi:hypothetical protein